MTCLVDSAAGFTCHQPDLASRARPPTRKLAATGAAKSFLQSLKVFRCGLTRATILGRLKAHFLTVAETLEPSTLNGRDVDEDIRRAVIGLDEAIPLFRVEPFYCACSHWRSLKVSKTSEI